MKAIPRDRINKNCLEGMRCPHCLSAGPFEITATTTVKMHDDGSDDHGDLEYDHTADAMC